MKTINFSLLNWQMEELKRNARFSVVMTGRRGNKTGFAVKKTLIKGIECQDPSAAVVYIAPNIRMARQSAWDAFQQHGKSIIESIDKSSLAITLVNGVTIYLAGADTLNFPEDIKLHFVALDEIHYFPTHVWDKIVQPMLGESGSALIIGTPEPGDNQFNRLFDYAESGVDNNWTAARISGNGGI